MRPAGDDSPTVLSRKQGGFPAICVKGVRRRGDSSGGGDSDHSGPRRRLGDSSVGTLSCYLGTRPQLIGSAEFANPAAGGRATLSRRRYEQHARTLSPGRSDGAVSSWDDQRCPGERQAGRANPAARGAADHDARGQVRPGRVQQRRLCDPRLPGLQPFGRRRVDAPRSRHDGARQGTRVPVDPRRAVARNTRRQNASAAVDHRAAGGEPPRDHATRERPARFHQLLSDERVPRVRHRFLSRPGVSRAAAGRGRSQHRPRLRRPAVFQDPGRHRVRPALAQREVPEQPRARALPDPDRGGREDALEELQEHREAGQGRVQAEEVMR